MCLFFTCLNSEAFRETEETRESATPAAAAAPASVSLRRRRGEGNGGGRVVLVPNAPPARPGRALACCFPTRRDATRPNARRRARTEGWRWRGRRGHAPPTYPPTHLPGGTTTAAITWPGGGATAALPTLGAAAPLRARAPPHSCSAWLRSLQHLLGCSPSALATGGVGLTPLPHQQPLQQAPCRRRLSHPHRLLRHSCPACALDEGRLSPAGRGGQRSCLCARHIADTIVCKWSAREL